MHRVITFPTDRHDGLYDITDSVRTVLKGSGIRSGLLNIYARGATVAVVIQENWDESVRNDMISLLKELIPQGIWEHDKQDGNGDSHLKSGLLGPSETIPVINGELALSTWQNIFFCEFDGPRDRREVVITIIEDKE